MAQPPSGAPVLQVTDLAVRAGNSALLAGVSLALAPGDLLAVTGPSGSGKTSLLRTLAGLVGDGDGIVLEGRTPTEIGWPRYRRRVVLVDQQPVLLDESVGFNLARPFAYRGAGTAFPHERARDLLRRLGLAEVELRTPAGTLSVGQQQRVSLLRALLLEPAVLLLDEPTSALDPRSTQRVEEIVRQAAASGMAALVVTHGLEQARRWCRRQIELTRFLVDGRRRT
ncbi:MAG: ATP-binding cassette domain-containing protein [Candidatus Krumholzibacteriia bacterium]